MPIFSQPFQIDHSICSLPNGHGSYSLLLPSLFAASMDEFMSGKNAAAIFVRKSHDEACFTYGFALSTFLLGLACHVFLRASYILRTHNPGNGVPHILSDQSYTSCQPLLFLMITFFFHCL